MAIICLQKGSGKRSRVREKSGNFDMDNEWQPCLRKFSGSGHATKGFTQAKTQIILLAIPLTKADLIRVF